MLPIESKLIHCRWSGESTWIPFGDFRPGLDYENHTLAPGARPAGDLPGRDQRVRDLLPVRRLHHRVEGRPAGGEPLRDRRPRRGLAGPPARDRPALPVGGRPGDPDRRGGRDGPTDDRPRRPRRDGRHRDRLAPGGRGGRRRADRGDRARPVRGLPPTADEVIDATGLLVLPGVDRRPHPHARRRPTTQPDRFFQDSVAAALRRHDDVPRLQQPGDRARRLRPSARCWPACANGGRRPTATARSTTASASRQRPDGRPARRAAGGRRGRRPDLQGVHGLRLPARRPAAVRGDAGHGPTRGGMLQVHCEDPVLLDAAVAGALAAW